MVPELKDLCTNWTILADYERGKKIGYIIGKYGLDVLAPGAAISGINKFRQLKRANTMFTLECCAASKNKQIKIIEASSKYTASKTIFSDSAKSGKIVCQNSNVAAHVMQKKHAWDRVVQITGNTENDFKNVLQFLETNKILEGKRNHIGRFPFKSSNPKIDRFLFEMSVNGEIVQAEFIEYISTKEFYLNDTWIKTRN